MSKLLSVSIPDKLAADTEALAAAQGTTKSEVVREALRRHVLRERFADLFAYGSAQAERLGIGPDDVERVIDEFRAQRRAER